MTYITVEINSNVLFFSPRTEMTAENLRWLENVFRRTVGENGEIRLQDFKNIVHSKNVSHRSINVIKRLQNINYLNWFDM